MIDALQAVEVKEGLKVNPDSVTQASVTYQCFFRYYERLAGMTVCAWQLEHVVPPISSVSDLAFICFRVTGCCTFYQAGSRLECKAAFLQCTDLHRIMGCFSRAWQPKC